MKILITELQDKSIVSIDLEGQNLTPEQLNSIEIPPIRYNAGIVLDGRAPIWLHCYLTSWFSAVLWIAIADPKLNGAVVVRSHSPEIPVGSIQSMALVI